MAGRRFIYGGTDSNFGGGSKSNLNSVLLPSQKPFNSLFASAGSSPSFLSGSRSMVSFEDVNGGNRSGRSFFQSFDQDDNGDDEFDDYFHQPEKKRRLKADQVQFLEKSFETENKLEPERKVQLAKDLGLQPRQVAIWFQNRRARWKTKTLEKDYDILQDSYNNLKAKYEDLLKEKVKLKAEVVQLSDRLLLVEKENLESFDTKSLSEAPSQLIVDLVNEGEVSNISANKAAKSDFFDSDSPHFTAASQSSRLEPGDSSYVFEQDQSDVSQDEEDSLLLPLPYTFTKIESADYPNTDSDLPASSCFFGFPSYDQPFGFWSY